MDLPLSVCHLGKYYPPAPGGMEMHVQTLARAQAALGADVRVLCVEHAGSPRVRGAAGAARANALAEESDGGVRVTRAFRRQSLSRLDWCPALAGLLRRLEAQGVRLLHLHTPNPTMLLALSLVRPALPLVITHHSDVIKQRLLKYAMRPFERFVYARAARVQTTSPVYREGSAFLQRYEGRLEVLPLGLELAPFARPNAAALAYAGELHRRHAIGPGNPLWLAVGRLVYYKGLQVAIEALARLPGTLLIVGTGGLEAPLRRLARQRGVADRVLWRGYLGRDELAGAYHAAGALWFPSNARSEAFGLVQVEAMASGCPVINTAIPHSGVPWVSRHEESGLTVPVNDPAALAAAARRLLEEPGLRPRLSAGARRRAAVEFDHLQMGRRSLEIYRRALAGVPPPVEAEAIAEPAALLPSALPFDRFAAPAAARRPPAAEAETAGEKHHPARHPERGPDRFPLPASAHAARPAPGRATEPCPDGLDEDLTPSVPMPG